LAQSDLIDDVDEPTVTADHVHRRVDDWLERLRQLFSVIKDWAATNGWTATDGKPLPLNEEPMVQFGLPPEAQPVLTLHSPTGGTVLVKPKALWVFGANGRVDLYSTKGAYTLVDVAEQFQPPQWRLHRVGQQKGHDFAPGQIADMV
jgi:hypothetical protein